MPPFAYVILIAVVVGVVLISKVLRTAQTMAQRPGELRDAAGQLSFEYRELEDGDGDEERLIEPAMKGSVAWEWDSTHRQSLEQVLIGSRDGFNVFVFDLSWKTRGAAPWFQTVLLCTSAQRLWTPCLVLPHSVEVLPPDTLCDRALALLDYDAAGEFGADFSAYAVDETRFRGLFGEQVAAFFADRVGQHACVEGLDDRFLFYNDHRQVPSAELQAFVDEGLWAAQRFAGR